MSNSKQFTLFVSKLSYSPISRQSKKFPEETKNYSTNHRRKRRYSEINQYSNEKHKLLTNSDPLNLKNYNFVIKEQSVGNSKIKEVAQSEIQQTTLAENNLINILNQFLCEDEKMILQDSFIVSHSFTPCTKNLYNTYLVKARIKYPEIFYNEFIKSSETNNIEFANIFTNLNIIYFVKENTIYIWNYVTNYQIVYNEIINPIVNIHITLPKPGIFSSNVNYIIVVATKIEVLILLIKQNDNKELEIHKSDFYYNSDNQIITSIISTSSSRIFLGSKNNFIWELDYSNSTSFFGFGKKIKKITRSKQSFFEKINPFSFYIPKMNYFFKMVVDNTRHLLYAITYRTNDNSIFDINSVTNSSIIIYDLGSNDNDFMKLGEIDQESITKHLRNHSIGINKKDQNYMIVDAIPLTRSDFKNTQLLLITKNGYRVYVQFYTSNEETTIKDFTVINEIDSNLIYQKRIIAESSYFIKPIPEPNTYDLLQTETEIHTYIKKIFYIDKKTFICYDDETNKRSYIDVIEPDGKLLNKKEVEFFNSSNESNKEIKTNVLCFPCREIYHIEKLPEKSSVLECDLFSLLKRSNYSNFLFPNIKFLDLTLHYSYTCMHENSTQIFLGPEEYVITTSVEAIYLMKLRPIDLLFSVITDVNDNCSFENFIFQYGIYETTFMLIYMISNIGFVFYDKKQQNLTKDNSLLNYTQEYREITNNDLIIAKATKYLYQIFEMILNTLNSMQINIENNIAQEIDSSTPVNNNITQKNKIPHIFYGQAYIEKKPKSQHFLTYSMFLFMSRIIRLFWEESLYFKIGHKCDYKIEETMKMHQIQYIKSLILSFQIKMKEIKDPLMQKTDDLYVKMRNIENNNKISHQQQKQKIQYFDCSNFKEEFNQVMLLCETTMEILSFVEIIYETLAFQPQIIKLNMKEISIIKFKELYKYNDPEVLENLLDGIYEIILNENDSISINTKIHKMSTQCPNILNTKQIEIIRANLLLKSAQKSLNQDTITKKNIIDKAVKLIISNPEYIKIRKIIDNLGELDEVQHIITVCVTKAIYLKKLLDKEWTGVNNSDTNQKIVNNNAREYKECLYTILKIFDEIQNSINRGEIAAHPNVPDYLLALLKNKSQNQLVQIQNDIIQEILTYDVQFIHVLLFNHLKSKNMLEDLFKIRSPYVEFYLNSQIEDDNTDPTRYESLYKFYFNSKNYEAAIRILLRLVNYDNKKNNKFYVDLENKRLYNKHLIYSLTMLLETEKESNRKKIYNDLKIKMSYLDETLSIQFDILNWLKKINQSKINDFNDEQLKDIEEAKNAIVLLERNKYSLEELYFDFSKKFKLYEINFRIYFEMHSRQIDIPPDEIKENIQNCFKMFKNTFMTHWKESAFVLLNQILITLIQIKTPYESFYLMLEENNFGNCLEKIIPLNFIIQTIENINQEDIFQNGFKYFSFSSSTEMTNSIYYFWLIEYLKDLIHLPLWYIYSIYAQFEENVHCNNFLILSNKIIIINYWCDYIKEYIFRIDLQKQITYSLDIQKFIEQKEEFLQVFQEYATLIKEKDLLLFLDLKVLNTSASFLQIVQNKYSEFIIKLKRIKD